jgi:hypothetical protein
MVSGNVAEMTPFLRHLGILGHGTDGFTSSPKVGMLRIFRPKNPTASAGFKLLIVRKYVATICGVRKTANRPAGLNILSK